MSHRRIRQWAGRLLLPWLLAATLPAQADSSLATALLHAAPAATPKAVRLAVQALDCARAHGEPAADRLAVIDFSRPSTQQRLWVFDLARHDLLFQEWVAHGRGSGDKLAQTFSNVPGSNASSLGLYRTLQTYVGHEGYSLRLQGLERGINHLAFDRAIVIHGAPYVDTAFATRTGRLGRSFGCPAVRKSVARPLIDSLKDNQYVFAYYPDQRWLDGSRYLHCDAAQQTASASPAPGLRERDSSL